MPFKDPAAQREYQREWMAARRADHLAGACCVDCGATESLELDHVDPALKADHKVWSWSETRRETEIAKCVIRCEDCHRARHAADRIRHGRKRYQKGCRCEVCRAAKRRDNAWQRPRVCTDLNGKGRIVAKGSRVRLELDDGEVLVLDRAELLHAIETRKAARVDA